MFANTSMKYNLFGCRLLPNLKGGLFRMILNGVT